MNKIRDFIDWINDIETRFPIRDNEVFSLPFTGRYKNSMKLVVFTYSSSMNFLEGTVSVRVKNAFYFEPSDYSKYEMVSMEESVLEEEIPLFEKAAPLNSGGSLVEIYHRMLDLTEQIMSDQAVPKEVFHEYAACFNAYVGNTLKKYYLYLGKEFFLWIDSML